MVRRHYNSKKDIWQTPDEVLDLIQENIDLDPCAAPDTSIGDINYTKDDDGLSKEWYGNVFINPPFTNKDAFLQKTIEQSEKGNTDVIFVITPDSTDVQSWWHSRIEPHSDYVWFSNGRIDYINPTSPGPNNNKATFGTAMSIFGEPSDETLRELLDNGHLVETIHQI